MFRKSLALLILVLSISACTRSTKVYEPTLLPTLINTEAAPAEVVAEFPTPTALSSQTLEPSIQPTVKPTLQPYEPFTVYSAVDGLFLRSGPGTDFIASTMLYPEDAMTTNFMAEGGEWLNVTTANGESGFVFTLLLKADEAITSVPIKLPDFVSVVKGSVQDAKGLPIQGVVIGFTQEDKQINVATDENGEFFFYHHPDATGSWTLSYAAISCVSNVWIGTDCAQMKPEYTGVIDPASLVISLPYSGDTIHFTWR